MKLVTDCQTWVSSQVTLTAGCQAWVSFQVILMGDCSIIRQTVMLSHPPFLPDLPFSSQIVPPLLQLLDHLLSHRFVPLLLLPDLLDFSQTVLLLLLPDRLDYSLLFSTQHQFHQFQCQIFMKKKLKCLKMRILPFTFKSRITRDKKFSELKIIFMFLELN